MGFIYNLINFWWSTLRMLVPKINSTCLCTKIIIKFFLHTSLIYLNISEFTYIGSTGKALRAPFVFLSYSKSHIYGVSFNFLLKIIKHRINYIICNFYDKSSSLIIVIEEPAIPTFFWPWEYRISSLFQSICLVRKLDETSVIKIWSLNLGVKLNSIPSTVSLSQ